MFVLVVDGVVVAVGDGLVVFAVVVVVLVRVLCILGVAFFLCSY